LGRGSFIRRRGRLSKENSEVRNFLVRNEASEDCRKPPQGPSRKPRVRGERNFFRRFYRKGNTSWNITGGLAYEYSSKKKSKPRGIGEKGSRGLNRAPMQGKGMVTTLKGFLS